MKRIVLIIAGLVRMQSMMAQWSTTLSDNQSSIHGSPDDSFLLAPDTLWFITGTDFVYGKEFHIINPHDYSIEIQHIDQLGIPCSTCIPWYTLPNYPVFPVSIPANDSIPIVVKFLVIDIPSETLCIDTLGISTTGFSGQVIIAADSTSMLIGLGESVTEQIIAAPNPFNDVLKINLGVTQESAVSVTVYNCLMQPVRELLTGKVTSSANSLQWDGTDAHGVEVSRGVYFISIRMASGLKTLKVVKR
jgi:hypothetical protein